MSLPEFLQGFASGAVVALSVLAGTILLHIVEAWRFARERGPLGALASVGRGWLHTRRDSDVGAAALAVITGVALPCLALTQAAVVGASSSSATVAAALLLGASGVPIVAALAGGPGSEARLALDDATRRAARHALLVGAVLVAPELVRAPIACGVVVAMLRQRHEVPVGLQPRADAALGAGTKLALDAAERASVLVIAWIAAVDVVLHWSGLWAAVPLSSWRAVPLGLAVVVIVAVGCGVVEWSGPHRMVARGLQRPLGWLFLAVLFRIAKTAGAIAADGLPADASFP
jgi:hypothetical protein